MTLLKLLEYIEQRPHMYLKEKKLDLLESFINGYFICQKHEYLTNQTAWPGLIKQISKREGKDEFSSFFELLKDFKKEKALR